MIVMTKRQLVRYWGIVHPFIDLSIMSLSLALVQQYPRDMIPRSHLVDQCAN